MQYIVFVFISSGLVEINGLDEEVFVCDVVVSFVLIRFIVLVLIFNVYFAEMLVI